MVYEGTALTPWRSSSAARAVSPDRRVDSALLITIATTVSPAFTVSGWAVGSFQGLRIWVELPAQATPSAPTSPAIRVAVARITAPSRGGGEPPPGRAGLASELREWLTGRGSDRGPRRAGWGSRSPTHRWPGPAGVAAARSAET